jgi:hypothetical protein
MFLVFQCWHESTMSDILEKASSPLRLAYKTHLAEFVL